MKRIAALAFLLTSVRAFCLTSPYFSTTNVWNGANGKTMTYAGASAASGVFHQMVDKYFFITGDGTPNFFSWYTSGVHDGEYDYTNGTPRALYPAQLLVDAFDSVKKIVRPDETLFSNLDVDVQGFSCIGFSPTNEITVSSIYGDWKGMDGSDRFYSGTSFWDFQQKPNGRRMTDRISAEIRKVYPYSRFDGYESGISLDSLLRYPYDDSDNEYNSARVQGFIPQKFLFSQSYLKMISRVLADNNRYAWYVATPRPEISYTKRVYRIDSWTTVGVSFDGPYVTFTPKEASVQASLWLRTGSMSRVLAYRWMRITNIRLQRIRGRPSTFGLVLFRQNIHRTRHINSGLRTCGERLKSEVRSIWSATTSGLSNPGTRTQARI